MAAEFSEALGRTITYVDEPFDLGSAVSSTGICRSTSKVTY